jgi:hypothetical protein
MFTSEIVSGYLREQQSMMLLCDTVMTEKATLFSQNKFTISFIANNRSFWQWKLFHQKSNINVSKLGKETI